VIVALWETVIVFIANMNQFPVKNFW